MAAETVSDYLENGIVKNSVNFPTVVPHERAPNSIRFVVVNKNEPGMLAKITEACAHHGLNILQQINNSRGDVAYNVLDLDATESDSVENFKDLQQKVTMLDGVLNSRVIFSELKAGIGFARNVDGDYIC